MSGYDRKEEPENAWDPCDDFEQVYDDQRFASAHVQIVSVGIGNNVLVPVTVNLV